MATLLPPHQGMDITFASNAVGAGAFPIGTCADGVTPIIAIHNPSNVPIYTKHRITPVANGGPADDRRRGGAVFDPSNPNVQGWDNRTYPPPFTTHPSQSYAATDHQIYGPSTVMADDEPSLTAFTGPPPGKAMTVLYYRGNANPSKSARSGYGMAVIVIVNQATVPANMIRPCLFHLPGGKPIETTANINFNALPLHSIPAGAVEPNWDAPIPTPTTTQDDSDKYQVLKYSFVDWGTNNGPPSQSFEYIAPTSVQNGFMGESGVQLQRTMLGALSNSPMRETLIVRLCQLALDIQWHVDYRDTSGKASTLYFARGGHGSGRAGVRFLCSYWLGRPTMRQRPPAITYQTRRVPFFTEDAICRIGPPRFDVDEYGNTYPYGWPYYGEDNGPRYESKTFNHMSRDFLGQREPWWEDTLRATILSATANSIVIDKWYEPSAPTVEIANPATGILNLLNSSGLIGNSRHVYFESGNTNTGVAVQDRVVWAANYNTNTRVLTFRNATQVAQSNYSNTNTVTGNAFVTPPSPSDVLQFSNGGVYLLNSNPARMLTCLNIVLAGKVDDWNAGWEKSIDGADPLPAGSKGAMFYYAKRWIDEDAEIAPKSRFIFNYNGYNLNGKLWADANSNWASKFYAAYAAAIWPQQGPGPYVQQRVNFNGTTYFKKTAQDTGMVDGPQGTLSLWLDIANPDSTTAVILNLATCVQLLRGSDNKLRVLLYNSTNQIVWDSKSTALYTLANGLTHIALAWNLTAPNPVAHMAINGTLLTHGAGRIDAVAPIAGNVNYGQTTAQMGFGATPSSGANGYSGQMGDLYFDTAFLDLSVAANLQKLIHAGQPVRPLSFGKIYFGDDMSATDWNAANGKGMVTGWTKSGAGVT